MDTINTDHLIWISTVDTFDVCLILFFNITTGFLPARVLSWKCAQNFKFPVFWLAVRFSTDTNFKIKKKRSSVGLDINNFKVFIYVLHISPSYNRIFYVMFWWIVPIWDGLRERLLASTASFTIPSSIRTPRYQAYISF